jgi:hypothetical protein
MSWRRTKLMATSVAVAMLFAAGFTLSTGEPAFAAGCSNTGCNGQDPSGTSCADSSSYNVYTRNVSYYASANYWANMTIYLRYSRTCGTNWAKAVVTGSNPSSQAYQMQVELQDNTYNYVDGTYTILANTRSVYGNMHYAPTTPMRACAAIDDANFPNGYYCTAAG